MGMMGCAPVREGGMREVGLWNRITTFGFTLTCLMIGGFGLRGSNVGGREGGGESDR